MRLLHTTTYNLEEFGSRDIPLYAILSHTWGNHEITFQDIGCLNIKTDKRCQKVKNACATARMHGFDYIWIDTCCIDKTSSAELSEAINSMYLWYQNSAICYAYLDDTSCGMSDYQWATIHELSESKWFTRGWTLQELIAPEIVLFLNQNWQEMGTKSSLKTIISAITGIPDNILSGDDLKCASIAQRMSWASQRETTRIEDVAYCLMGIFNVHMPMLYGEGDRAFIRLQEEIIKVSDDHSIFAWESIQAGVSGGLLATSPAAFSKSSKIVPDDSSRTASDAITMNSRGIHLKL